MLPKYLTTMAIGIALCLGNSSLAHSQSFLMDQTVPTKKIRDAVTIKPYQPSRDTNKIARGETLAQWKLLERSGDWVLQCLNDIDTGQTANEHKSACRMVYQKLVKSDDDNANKSADAFSFTIDLIKLPKKKKMTPVAIVSTPMNVLLPVGVALTIDKSQALKLAIRSCHVDFENTVKQITTNCLAPFQLAPTLLKRFKNGGQLQIGVTNLQGKPIKQTISLIGFTKIYNQLIKGQS